MLGMFLDLPAIPLKRDISIFALWFIVGPHAEQQ
jgi:hypothetical protein